MTAIKKTTAKKASPAPATKSVPTPKTAPAAKPAAKKKAAVTPAAATVGLAAVAAKAIASTAVATTVTARIDIGFGNTLYVRGEGPGLSWDKGVPMTCIADDQWQAVLGESARPFTLKFLVNDLTWSVGPDFVVPSGANASFSPAF